MNRRLYSWAIRVLLVGALLPGCATGPRMEKRARRPGESAVGKEASKPGGETGEERKDVVERACGASREPEDRQIHCDVDEQEKAADQATHVVGGVWIDER